MLPVNFKGETATALQNGSDDSARPNRPSPIDADSIEGRFTRRSVSWVAGLQLDFIDRLQKEPAFAGSPDA